MATHLIHRQVLDLRYTDQRKAKAAMNQWTNRFQTDWQPIIAEVLDELDSEGDWIQLERVEVDLGKISEGLAPELFRQKLKEALKTQLLRLLPEKPFQGFEKASARRVLTRDERKPLELLIYLLQTGRKPWWASHSKKENIRSLIRKLSQDNPRGFSAWLQVPSFTPTMLFRLEKHLGPTEIREVIHLGSSEKQEQAMALIQDLATAFSPAIYSKLELEKKWEKSWIQAFFLPKNQLSDPISIWIKTNLWSFAQSPSSFPPSLEALTELFTLLIPKGFTQPSKLHALEKAWTKWTQTPEYNKAKHSNSSLNTPLSAEILKFRELVKTGFVAIGKTASSTSEQLAQEKLGRKSSVVSTSEKLVLDETIPISNAGLVLAAPFLPYFFKGLGLVEKKQFISPEAQNRGVLLLQALLDDSFSYQESDLILNKIICGIDPSEPIEVSFSPTESEREEIKNLLDAMVSQWTALKSTSGKSMAMGFFPREGSLKRTGQGYQLTIPRISIDILLNRLPWAISIIKLPWMNETLFTEW